jgi:hypothetical protein
MKRIRNPRYATEFLERKLSPSGAAAVAYVAPSPMAVHSVPASAEASGVGDSPDPSDFYPEPIGPEPPDFNGDDIPFVLLPPLQIGPAGPAF